MSGPGTYASWLDMLKGSPHYLRLMAEVGAEYKPRIDRLERDVADLGAERDRLASQVSDLLQEREDADHEARCEVESRAAESERLRGVLRHVVAMADDAYFSGHPEWAEIVREARAELPGGRS